MTRERRLAVKMWHDVADNIRQGAIEDFNGVMDFRNNFIHKHNLKWYNEDWFCEYMGMSDGCSKCRLYIRCGGNCNDVKHNYYAMMDKKVDKYGLSLPYAEDKEEFADYADNIADLLEGK